VPVWVNAFFTAAVSGILVALPCSLAVSAEAHDVRCWITFAIGAGVGLVNWWRRSPDQRQR
jgi:hypothetical protein